MQGVAHHRQPTQVMGGQEVQGVEGVEFSLEPGLVGKEEQGHMGEVVAVDLMQMQSAGPAGVVGEHMGGQVD